MSGYGATRTLYILGKNNIISLNLQKIVRDFDSKESPWFDDTLKSFKWDKSWGLVLDKPAAVDARKGGWKVHQIQSSVPWSLVETMLWHVTILKLVKLHQGILLNIKPGEIISGDAELWFNVVEELLVQDLMNKLDFKELLWRNCYLELTFVFGFWNWYLDFSFGIGCWNWLLELIFGIVIWYLELVFGIDIWNWYLKLKLVFWHWYFKYHIWYFEVKSGEWLVHVQDSADRWNSKTVFSAFYICARGNQSELMGMDQI